MLRSISLTVLLLNTTAQDCKQYSGRAGLDCATQSSPAIAANASVARTRVEKWNFQIAAIEGSELVALGAVRLNAIANPGAFFAKDRLAGGTPGFDLVFRLKFPA